MKHTKFIALMLSIVLMLTMFPVSIAFAENIVSDLLSATGDVIGSGDCGENLTWTLYENGLLHISGEGEMYDYEGCSAPWNRTGYAEYVKHVKIEKGVTYIGAYSFYSLGYGLHISGIGQLEIQDIEIPDTVTRIGSWAFGLCEKLTDVYYSGTEEQWDKIIVLAAGNECLFEIAVHYNSCFHNYSTVVTAPTCTTEGYTTHICEDCGYSYTDSYVEVTEHTDENEDKVCDVCGNDVLNIINSGVCGENVTWTLYENGTLDIVGTGDMYDFVYEGEGMLAPWIIYSSDIINVTLSDTITSIGNYAFCDYSNIVSVEIPDSVTRIGEWALAGCTELESIAISANVTEIGTSAFSDCTSFAGIYVDSLNENYSSDEYGVLFDKNATTLIQFPAGSDVTDYSIPESVTSIGYAAFSSAENLVNVEIHKNVENISYCAFMRCANLESITILNPEAYIDDYHFTIDENAVIYGYDNSTAQAYAEKYDREFVSLGEYEEPAEPDKENVVDSGGCGENVTWILYENGTLEISGTGEMCNYIDPDGEPDDSLAAPWFEYHNDINNVVISEGVTTIGNCAFVYCYNICNIAIPDSVTSIGYSSFYCCQSLDEIIIPSSVISIGNGAFSMCENLTEIIIPESVTSIGSGVFMHCNNLNSVTIPASVSSIGKSAFYGCTRLISITVDENNEYYSSDDYGVLFNNAKTELLQYPCGNTRISYSVPDTVICIKESSFYNSKNLENIIIPASVASIEYGAFVACESLASIIIPDSVTNIESDIFAYCNQLETVVLSNSMTNIGNYMFFNCENLVNIIIPDSVISIDHCAFSGCSSLEDITIPSSVKYIGDYAFECCESLTSIEIPANVTSIGANVLCGCYSLESITFLNPTIFINDEWGPIDENAVIYGYDNSTAQAYAEKYDREFVVIGDEETTAPDEETTAPDEEPTEPDEEPDEEPEEPDEGNNTGSSFFSKIIEFFNKIGDFFRNIFSFLFN